ncbi:MAG: HD domain-containing protein [Candidatus Saccharimonas sp.]|nr:HD domain-containing protein [Candidatus Saccharimonas sp.]
MDVISPELLYKTRDEAIELGRIATRFARVERAPRMPDGRRETDVEHSFHLGLTAAEWAARFYPELDQGLISQFANVHDLVEVYTGDVWTFAISDEDRVLKEQNEHIALARLLEELPDYTADILRRYEAQTEPEARFVRLVDKCVPGIINIVGIARSTFLDDYKVDDVQILIDERIKQMARLKQMFPEFPAIFEIRNAISQAAQELYFPGTTDQ